MGLLKFFRYPFGISGDKTEIPDKTQPSGAVSYETGFGFDYERDPATDANAKDVPRQETNQIFHDITANLRQFQAFGLFPYIVPEQNGGAPFAYGKAAQCLYDAGKGLEGYESLVDNNTSLPTDATKWRQIRFQAGPDNSYLASFGGGMEWRLGRPILTNDIKLYVRPDGNDNNNGLANSPGSAFKTWQRAVDYVSTLDMYGYRVSIYGVEGTYPEDVYIGGTLQTGGSIARIEGEGTKTCLGSLRLSGVVSASRPRIAGAGGDSGFASEIELANLAFTAQSATVARLWSYFSNVALSGDIIVGPAMFGIVPSRKSVLRMLSGRLAFNGKFDANPLHVTLGSNVDMNNVAVTCNTVTCQQFAFVNEVSFLDIGGCTFVGSCTGSRYAIGPASGIQTYGGGANYLPGNAAGQVAPGGAYA